VGGSKSKLWQSRLVLTIIRAACCWRHTAMTMNTDTIAAARRATLSHNQRMSGTRKPTRPFYRDIEFFENTLRIEQDVSGELGGTVWDASLMMLKFFESDLENFPLGHWRGKKVLELGSGTGVLSICLALLQADVVATDLEVLLPLMKKNFELNHCDPNRCKVLRWGDDRAVFGDEEKFDYIILADCIAPLYSEHYPALMDTLERRIAKDGVLLIAHELRSIEDRAFYDLLQSRGWSISRVSNARLHDDFQSGLKEALMTLFNSMCLRGYQNFRMQAS
jgi:2-polyprenyl-3-methyl-5-hydroxy-6-metoxy-1,4-benzoquinol methylase